MRYETQAEIWLWTGKGAWHFITLPAEVSQGLRSLSGPRVGWGSVRVEAQIGATRWRTSVFPDSKSGGYLLPIKADVRKAEGLKAGDLVEVAVELAI
jgi:hypothetical protein